MATRRAVLAGAAAALALPAPSGAAPQARLIDPRFAAFGTAAGPDHGAWAAFLARYLVTDTADGIARLRYAAAAAEGARPAAYLAAMAEADPRAMRPGAAMAYWINLYNALTVDLVIEAWPVATIRRVRGGLFGSGPWDKALLSVAGLRLSLDDIEHGVLRPVFRDPRVHYAVNCASLGCPNLAPRPYAESDLGAMLEAAAGAYVNHPRGARIADGRLVVSSIYRWFAEDFGGDDAGVIAHLAAHAAPPLAAALAGRSRIDGDGYDWAINAA